jgi:hypothetical protein
VVFSFIALFIKFSKWSNSNKKSAILKAIIYIIRVVVKETDKCIKENRGYNTLFVVKT